MYAEQQRYWVSLLNLARTWEDDDSAVGFIPPRYRDFESTKSWPRRKALTFLHNNLELIRESYRRLETGKPPDWALLNHGLAGLTLRLNPWTTLGEIRAAARAKADLGGRIETLQVTSAYEDLNPGTRYIRATIERSLFYFARYVDARIGDPAYPDASPGAWRVVERDDGSGDLTVMAPESSRTA